MVKKTKEDYMRDLEDVIIQLIREYNIPDNDREDFAQEIRLYCFLNMDKAQNPSAFIYHIKKGDSIKKILKKFVSDIKIEYLEDLKDFEYSIDPLIYRHEIREIVKKAFPFKEEWLKEHADVSHLHRRVINVDRDRDIVFRVLLYGEGYTEISKDYDITPERVRGIIAHALRRLRKPLNYKKIKDYFYYDLED